MVSLKKFFWNLCRNWKKIGGSKSNSIRILTINWKTPTQHFIAVPMQKSFQLIINVHAKARSLPLYYCNPFCLPEVLARSKSRTRSKFQLLRHQNFPQFRLLAIRLWPKWQHNTKITFPHLVHPPRKEISHHTHISRSFFRAPATSPRPRKKSELDCLRPALSPPNDCRQATGWATLDTVNKSGISAIGSWKALRRWRSKTFFWVGQRHRFSLRLTSLDSYPCDKYFFYR